MSEIERTVKRPPATNNAVCCDHRVRASSAVGIGDYPTTSASMVSRIARQKDE